MDDDEEENDTLDNQLEKRATNTYDYGCGIYGRRWTWCRAGTAWCYTAAKFTRRGVTYTSTSADSSTFYYHYTLYMMRRAVLANTVLDNASKTANATESPVMPKRKRIALVAHDNKKMELINCLKKHRKILAQHELFGTGTTGSLVENELNLTVTKFKSGPLGGDQQLGAKIASQELDMLFFLIDPLYSHPHNADIQALLRLAQVWNVVSATTVASIDFILTSPKMGQSYTHDVYLTPAKPTAVKQEEKSTSLHTQHGSVINEKLKFLLARLSFERYT